MMHSRVILSLPSHALPLEPCSYHQAIVLSPSYLPSQHILHLYCFSSKRYTPTVASPAFISGPSYESSINIFLPASNTITNKPCFYSQVNIFYIYITLRSSHTPSSNAIILKPCSQPQVNIFDLVNYHITCREETQCYDFKVVVYQV